MEEANRDNLQVSRLGRAWRFLVEHGPIEAWRLARRYGWRASTRFIARNLRHLLGDAYIKGFDFRYGVDTGGEASSTHLDALGENVVHGTDFVPSPPRTFLRLIDSLG